MMKAISDIQAKVTALGSKAKEAIKSHLIAVAYIAALAVIAIPLASHVFHYWKPVVESWTPATQSKAVARRGP